MIKTFQANNSKVWSVAFSPKEKYLLAGSCENIIKLWNFESIKQVNSLQRHGKSILSITFSTDGKYMASSNTDNMLKLWSVEA
jgi:WD40 repeat protein